MYKTMMMRAVHRFAGVERRLFPLRHVLEVMGCACWVSTALIDKGAIDW